MDGGKTIVITSLPVGLTVLLAAVLANSVAELALILLFSVVNALGVRGGDLYGRWLSWCAFLVSGVLLQRSQIRLPMIIVCMILSVMAARWLEKAEPRRPSGANVNSFPLPPELLKLLFGASTLSYGSEVAHPDRQWLSTSLHSVLQQVVPLGVPKFDIGGKLPLFSTRAFREMTIDEVRGTGLTSKDGSQAEPKVCAVKQSSKSTKDAPPPSIGPIRGFEIEVDFSYVSDENTKIEVEIPMKVPIWGDLTVPVMVAAPEIAGQVRIEFRHDVLELVPGSGDWQKVMALSIMFEPIKEIHIHNIHISLASSFQLLQYVPIVKRYMKEAVNTGLAPNQRRIMIFDSSFGSLGSTVLSKEDVWNIPGIMEHAKKEAEAAKKGDKLSAGNISPCEPQSPDSSLSESGSKTNTNKYPVLDLSDPHMLEEERKTPVFPSGSPLSASPSSPNLNVLSKEIDPDVPIELQPGPVRERDPDEGSYPQLTLE